MNNPVNPRRLNAPRLTPLFEGELLAADEELATVTLDACAWLLELAAIDDGAWLLLEATELDEEGAMDELATGPRSTGGVPL